MKKNRFNFDKKILEMLDNLDLIPKTQTDPLPGVGGRLFIITKSQQNYFKQICDTLALVPEEHMSCMLEVLQQDEVTIQLVVKNAPW